MSYYVVTFIIYLIYNFPSFLHYTTAAVFIEFSHWDLYLPSILLYSILFCSACRCANLVNKEQTHVVQPAVQRV